jgi:hypothetical protein
MKQFPTTADLASLGIELDDDGFGPHEGTVAEIVALARLVMPDLATVDVLGDVTAPEVVRARAFSVLAANWQQCHILLLERDRINESFTDLLSAWSHHQDLRLANSSLEELLSSRTALDQSRLEAARQRRLAGDPQLTR